MKVKQLIKQLEKLNPEALVILSSDSEGNDFNPLCDIGSKDYYWDKRNRCFVDLEDENAEKGIDAICLWP